MTAEQATRTRRSVVIGIVFAIATLLFVWGALSESSGDRDTHAGREPSEEIAGETSEHADEARSAEAEHEEEEFKPFGIDVESTPLVIVAAIVSLIVAAMVAWRPTCGWLFAVLILGIAFAALEVAEVVHQANEENIGLLLVALIACITHALAAVLAGREVRAIRRSETPLTA